MIYVFECPMCNAREELMLKMEDRDKVRPHCVVCELEMNTDVPMNRIATPVAGYVRNPAVPRS